MGNEGSSEGSSSPESDHVSLKSDQSITPPPNFSDEPEIFINNPRAEDGLQGWEVKNGGDGSVTENNRKPNRRISLKRPLKEEDYSDAFLDLQPPIKISDWCAPRAEFQILQWIEKKILEFEKVKLKEENDEPWLRMTHIFEEDKPGAQFIRGKDTQFWKDCVDHGGELETTAEVHGSSNTHMEELQMHVLQVLYEESLTGLDWKSEWSEYDCDLTLDPNTANTRLILSDEEKIITDIEELFFDHLERSDDNHQVLCEESQTGLNWESEGSGCAYGGEFRSTAELHKYACDLTLDPNTANTRLILSEENRKVSCVKDHQSYPDHPERFDDVPQVLCGESLTGRCYWEAEWSGCAEISVTYKGISRKGWSDSLFGFNDKS